MESKRRSFVGQVVGDKNDKTVMVQVERRRPHPLYRKMMRRHMKLQAHDAENACRVGDIVRIEESRPVSKAKHWRVAQIVSRGEAVEDVVNDTAV